MINVIEDIIEKYKIEKTDADWLKMIFEELLNDTIKQETTLKKGEHK